MNCKIFTSLILGILSLFLLAIICLTTFTQRIQFNNFNNNSDLTTMKPMILFDNDSFIANTTPVIEKKSEVVCLNNTKRVENEVARPGGTEIKVTCEPINESWLNPFNWFGN